MDRNFHVDEQGNVILHPVTGWVTAPAVGMNVFLTLESVSTPEEAERHRSTALHYILTPQQALALADQLRKLAQRLLETPPAPLV